MATQSRQPVKTIDFNIRRDLQGEMTSLEMRLLSLGNCATRRSLLLGSRCLISASRDVLLTHMGFPDYASDHISWKVMSVRRWSDSDQLKCVLRL